MIGQTISRYKILEKLGEGGMGAVYLAEDAGLGRKVAVKLLSQDKAADPDSRKRFMHEAKAQAMLNHPNIVSFYEVGEEADKVFIAMEYIEGQPLSRLAKAEELSLKEILNLAIQIGEGLEAAHSQGVVHRDVKPDNVLITSNHEVKITDFGLAKWKGATTITKSGVLLGTAYYMSPEQAQGEKVDHRSDLFSFGIILYELITQRLPFKGEKEAAIIYSICYEEPEPLARFKGGVPENLQGIVGKTLEKDKNRRYQSAADMVADLKALQKEISTGTVYILKKRFKQRKAILSSIAATIILVAGLVAIKYFLTQNRIAQEPRRIMLAVLPFRNLGPPEQENFADGLTDEITANLAKISSLGVISNTSAIQYKNAKKNVRQIGSELGADYLLEGSVRMDKSGGNNRVKIDPQLVKVKDDTHLWADTYTGDMSQIFEVQSGIAEKVARALNIVLLEPEQQYLKTKPTNNIEAYQFYLDGISFFKQLQSGFSCKECFLTTEKFRKAIELDSTFTLAYAMLSRTYTLGGYRVKCPDKATIEILRRNRPPYTEEVWLADIEQKLKYLKSAGIKKQGDSIKITTYKDWWEKAAQAVNRAIEFKPDLPEAHLSLGYYHYWRYSDYDRALKEFAIAQKGLPNNSDLLFEIGRIQIRQGLWEKANGSLKKASKLDPRSNVKAFEAGKTYSLMRDYPNAESYFNKVISVAPNSDFSATASAYYAKAELYLHWRGNTAKARNLLQEGWKTTGVTPLVNGLIECDILDGNYEEALGRRSGTSPGGNTYTVGDHTLAAKIYGLMNQPKLMYLYYDSARIELEPLAQKNSENPGFADKHAELGVAYAGLGRKEDALREGKKAVELLPVSKDAVKGPEFLEGLAEIYTMVGEYDAAIDQLKYLLSIPSEISIPYLKIAPTWNPLRNHPRFKKLLAGK